MSLSKDNPDFWRKALLPADSTVQQAIRNLDESGLQIAMVVENGDTLVGTITDGDIRRGLLRGLDLSSPIEAIVHRDAFVVPPQMGRDVVLALMSANVLHCMPVVDDRRRVIGLHVFNELLAPPERENRMVIMAGGRGTRLRPHTESCPKPLLPVAGRPMLEHIIERAKSEGFRRFTLAVHYLAHMIEDYCGAGERWQVDIDYLREPSPLGTAGALSLLDLPDHPFVVSNGDVLTDIHYGDLLDYHLRQKAVATMAVRLHEWEHPFGVVRSRGVEIIGFDEKPVMRTHVNAGIYVLDPGALDALDGDVCDMPTLFERLRAAGKRVVVYPMHEPWLDVGRPDDLTRAENGNN